MPDPTGSAALDVVIGLAFVYLLFSLLCSAVQEGIAGVFDLRARNLEAALRSLLEDKKAGQTGSDPPAAESGGRDLEKLADKFYDHGLIRGLYKDAGSIASFGRKMRGPSYIQSRTFATALLDLLAPDAKADDPVQSNRSSCSSSSSAPTATSSARRSRAGSTARWHALPAGTGARRR